MEFPHRAIFLRRDRNRRSIRVHFIYGILGRHPHICHGAKGGEGRDGGHGPNSNASIQSIHIAVFREIEICPALRIKLKIKFYIFTLGKGKFMFRVREKFLNDSKVERMSGFCENKVLRSMLSKLALR